MTVDLLAVILWCVCIVLVLLPPRYDPAIWLKEWLERDDDEHW